MQPGDKIDGRVVETVFNAVAGDIKPVGFRGTNNGEIVKQTIMPVVERNRLHKSCEIQIRPVERIVAPVRGADTGQPAVFVLGDDEWSDARMKHMKTGSLPMNYQPPRRLLLPPDIERQRSARLRDFLALASRALAEGRAHDGAGTS